MNVNLAVEYVIQTWYLSQNIQIKQTAVKLYKQIVTC